MIKALFFIIMIPLTVGTVLGLISSYRAGQTPLGDLYQWLKKYAQQIPARAIWRHIKSYYMYYGLLLILCIGGIQG